MGSDPNQPDGRLAGATISIHAPRMGSDGIVVNSRVQGFQFQSTLPGWGATDGACRTADMAIFQSTLPGWGATYLTVICVALIVISIHAPRMGSDLRRFRPFAPRNRYFNPRSPDGERLAGDFARYASHAFQSTLPGWGATSTTQ